METIAENNTLKHFLKSLEQLGPEFAKREDSYDKTASFVKENYESMKNLGYFKALVPEELGGGGMYHQDMSDLLFEMAQISPSTALAFSMHQHLVAANLWKYKRGQGGEDVLQKVAAKNLVLISTGAKDWLDSNGSMRQVEGGYRVSAKKYFASQSAFGDVAVTSAIFNSPNEGELVLHFPVPMNSEGVSLLADWDTLGMRGTGSQTIEFNNVFVPNEAIAMTRPKGTFHPFFNVVVTVAMPLIMSVYLGIAKKAFELVRSHVAKQKTPRSYALNKLGEIYNAYINAQVNHESMLMLANNLDFDPKDGIGVEILTRKTNVANAAIEVVSKSLDLMGGKSFYKNSTLEKLFRDVQGARYHPLPELEQQYTCGQYFAKSQG